MLEGGLVVLRDSMQWGATCVRYGKGVARLRKRL
jgi:hypothetical protein